MVNREGGQSMGMAREHGPIIQKLLSQGWTIDYGFVGDSSKWGHYGYDTLTLTRPRQEKPVPQQAVQALWQAYQKAMMESNAGFNPFMLFFR